MSRKVIKKTRTFTLDDLKPEELRNRLLAQDFFNSFPENQTPEWKVLLDDLIDRGLEGSIVYLEVLYRLDLSKLKNLARYIEMSFKKQDQFPNQIRDIYSYSELKDLLIKRWLDHIQEDQFKFFKVLEEYFLPPKL